MSSCHDIRERLALDARSALIDDPEVGEHVATCQGCTEFLRALEHLDQTLGALPDVEAPRDTIEATLEAVTRNDAPSRENATWFGFRGSTAVAAVAVAVAVLGLWTDVFVSPADFWKVSAPSSVQEPYLPDDALASQYSANRPPLPDGFQFDNVVGRELYDPQSSGIDSSLPGDDDELLLAGLLSESESISRLLEPTAESPGRLSDLDIGADAPGGFAYKQDDEVGSLGKVQSDRDAFAAHSNEVGLDEELASLARAYDKEAGQRTTGDQQPVENSAMSEAGEAGNGQKLAAEKRKTEQRTRLAEQIRQQSQVITLPQPASPLVGSVAPAATADGTDIEHARQVARQFLSARDSTERVLFQPAVGYWANTYVPGDPSMRMLAARLQRWQRELSPVFAGNTRPRDALLQNWQPFDAPRDAALATFVHADKSAIDARTRLKLQIGIRGADRRGGHRPAMNVGVVLDLRHDLGVTERLRVRTLIDALERARQPGDRFSLTVAGPVGGTLLEPDDFRLGPVRVMMNRLLSDTNVAAGERVDLNTAMRRAVSAVRQDDDPASTLGASLVLLITTSPIEVQMPALEPLVHANAINGIIFSALPLGDQVKLGNIRRLVLLGQGQQLALGEPHEAASVVDRALHSASRAVARAVRLRIRLAPGVKLVQVLGSRRLHKSDASRVREAERSIDQRLARNLGIGADRGDDEEGIQIVIPSFYAGDSHVVLLDVVADRPGRIADVTVRYKDVVYLRNAVSQAQLSLPSGTTATGPLERNVIKNQLAQMLSDSARRAADLLASGDVSAAAAQLSTTRSLLTGLREEVPAWHEDHELATDSEILDEYLSLLRSPLVDAREGRQFIVASLRYVAHRRVNPPLDLGSNPVRE